MSCHHRKQPSAAYQVSSHLIEFKGNSNKRTLDPKLWTRTQRVKLPIIKHKTKIDMKQQQKNSIYKRKKRKEDETINTTKTTTTMPVVARTRTLSQSNHANVLLCITLAILICDIWSPLSGGRRALLEVAEADQQQQQGAQTPNRQRLLEEPKDTIAALGQPADLACLVENKRGKLNWVYEGTIVSFDNVLVDYRASRYSLPETSAISTSSLSGAASGELVSASNYSLHISGVELSDDGHFYCVIGNKDQEHRIVKSRLARLTVLQPPTKLTLLADFLSPFDDENQTGSISDPQQPPESQHLSYLQTNNSATDLAKSSGDPSLLSSSGSSNDQHHHHHHHHQHQYQAITSDELHNETVRVIVVRQNSRLRLECRADKAKPHAELVWLDHQQREVPKRGMANGSSGDDQSNNSSRILPSYVEELVHIDQDEPKLAFASLVWSFRVQRHHSNQLLTCLAQHPAYEHFPHLYGQKLRQQVRLDVHYEPEIDLTKDQLHAYEDRPIKFQCHAQAKPNQLTYRWFIDDQPVANATEPELYIERLTRQMHLREIKCEVSNSVGNSSAVLRLAVRYSPAYVTHLLPASLQPASFESQLITEHEQQLRHRQANSISNSGRSSTRGGQKSWWPKPAELALSRQLALGFDLGQDVQLRCDFDSNPRLQQVLWYKVSTDFSIMSDVTPAEADELIATGAAHAIFRERPSPPHTSGAAGAHIAGNGLDTPPLNHQHHQHQHSKRDSIVSTAQTSDTQQVEAVSNQGVEQVVEQMLDTLDYEQMSIELLHELAIYDTKTKQQQNSSDAYSSYGQVVEPIASQAPTQTNARIYEPLNWVMTTAQPLKSSVDSKPSQTPAGGLIQQQEQEREQHVDSQLSLIRPHPVNWTTTSGSVSLVKREAQVSSSFISLTSANEDSMGKYVCKAKSVDGSPQTARAVYLVLRQPPRIVSCSHQWAPLGSRQVQVECMTQINTVVDNVTTISWSKDGKAIHVMSKDQSGSSTEKSYAISEQRSPDLLFMRSVLRVTGAELYDFGQYNCTITNSLGSDSMVINLQPSAPTGFVFAVMASLAIGTVLVLVCIASLMIVFTPRRKLDAKSISLPISKADTTGNHTQDCRQMNGSLASSEDRKSPQSMGTQEERISSSYAKDQQQHCDNELANNNNHQQPRQHSVPQLTANSMIRDQLVSPLSHHQQQDHVGGAHHAEQSDSSDSNNSSSNRSQHLRSSLRQPIIGSSSQHRSSKFAAIHESLEHKLHLGQPLGFSTNNRAPPSDLEQQQQQQQHQSQQSSEVQKSQAISELERSSLLNRLWTRLLMKPERSALGASGRRVKSRPIISMPVSVTNQRSNMKRSSLSTSLSVLGVDGSSSTPNAIGSDGTVKTNNDNSINLNHQHIANGGHGLVSSSANLIQDSATASDGTVSSSRSSSSSGHHNNGMNHETSAHNAHLHLSYNPTNNYIQQGLWIQPQPPSSTNHSPKLLMVNDQTDTLNTSPLDCSLYVNGATNTYQPENTSTSHLYTNGHLPYTANNLDQSTLITNGGYTSQPLNWNDHHNQSAPPIEHYQPPMGPLILGDSYFATQQQPLVQQNGRPYYATICNKSTGQQFATTNNNNYGTLPIRPASTQCHQLVPTSDGGDAYFESNYGTLISRSSAYKTLGYATSPVLSMQQQQNNGHSPNSSSPNSLTTHANNNLSNLNQQDSIHQRAASTTLPGGEIQFNGDNQITIVQSDGSTTAATNLNDNGLATHV